MKKYIRNSGDCCDLTVIIEYSIDYTNNQVAASQNFEDSMPNSVYAKYDAFIINMEKEFAQAGFTLQEKHSSDRHDSLSKYYAIYPADSDKNPVYTVLIILRVSDHRLKKGQRHGYKYYNKYAQQNKYPTSKEYQFWQFEQILVNHKSCNSYDDAMIDIENLIHTWVDKSSNNDLVSL